MQPPDYLKIPADELGHGHCVSVQIVPDAARLAEQMAADIADEIRAAAETGLPSTLIVPVGPVDQFPVLARRLSAERISCRHVAFINMDEYLDDADAWLPVEHPLSFRGFMQRAFYDLLDSALAPAAENRVFPDPRRPEAIGQLIERRGGVDACFGGIGINGHLAFNEPPEPGETMTVEQFAALGTRVLSLARETRTINAVTVGGEIGLVPRRAVTIGMREILAARRLRFYCNRPWQRSVVRRALHGPLTPECPASLLRLHADARLTITAEVA
ncbi:MAG TPA: glucosamine-6-phosphate isomerase, partial [Pirellulales bacterium]|nr:glucosamine-6-phosphate isomerase [Pirellulales bacterium]